MDVPSSTVVVGSVFAQCAESKVYECDFYGCRAVCKHRFRKEYRHPVLDQKLREQRTVREARALARCCKHGVEAPTVYSVDRAQCAIIMARIEGLTVRDIFNNPQQCGLPTAAHILTGIGEVVGLLHNADIVHGDLTTSNFMYVPQNSEPTAEETGSCRKGLVVLDFGLVADKNSAEERAVDLYVLERAIKSSHPFLENATVSIFEGYKRTIDGQKGTATLARLEAVRARGRKRSMVG